MFNKDQEQEMVRLYMSGMTAAECSKKFGKQYGACCRALNRAGILYRHPPKHKYSCNEEFFDVIDSEYKAYWLGFITADGYVNENDNILEINIGIKDICHLTKFKQSIAASQPIRTYHYKDLKHPNASCRINICSKKMVSSLVRLGVRQGKSFNSTPCNGIPDDLLCAYWRGCFDGDGGISCNLSGNTKLWQVSFVGCSSMVSGFDSYMQRFGFAPRTIRAKQNSPNIKQIDYNGVANPQRVLKILYHNASVYLDRKMALSDLVFGTPILRKFGYSMPHLYEEPQMST